MGKVGPKVVRVWLDGLALSGYLNAAIFNLKQNVPVVTTFSDTGPRRVVGGYDYDFDFAGFFDGSDDTIDEILHDRLQSANDHLLGVSHEVGGNEGGIIYEARIKIRDKPLVAKIGAATMLGFKADGDNTLARSVMLAQYTPTGISNRTGRNMGTTPSTSTFQMVVRVIAGTFTSITVDCQESSDDAAADPYANIAGLTVTRTTIGVSRVTVAAATEAWKRVRVSAFTGTSCDLVVTAGRVQGT